MPAGGHQGNTSCCKTLSAGPCGHPGIAVGAGMGALTATGAGVELVLAWTLVLVEMKLEVV